MKVGDLVEGTSPENNLYHVRGFIVHVFENELTHRPTYWVWLEKLKYHHEFFHNQLKLLSEA